jgi:hypothetical protein
VRIVGWLRIAARTAAYVIAAFLSAVWFASALASLARRNPPMRCPLIPN